MDKYHGKFQPTFIIMSAIPAFLLDRRCKPPMQEIETMCAAVTACILYGPSTLAACSDRQRSRPSLQATEPHRIALYCSLSFAFQVSNGDAEEEEAASAKDAYDDDDIDEELEKVAMAVEEEVAAAAAAAANSADNNDADDNR